MPPKILVISGPTASGKTRLAVELALRHGGEVVSADSMQIYRRMDIGTAKPTPEEMRGVPHHMLDVADPEEDFSVARYVELAAPCVDDILARGKLPIVAGGTGLYIDSLLSGRTFAPFSPDSPLRRRAGGALTPGGGRPCWGSWPPVDPEAAARLHPNDHKRIVRALEVYQYHRKDHHPAQPGDPGPPAPVRCPHPLPGLSVPGGHVGAHRPAGGRDDGRRPGGGGPGPPGLRCPGAVHRHAGHRLQGDGRRPARRRRCLRRRGGDQAPLPAVRQAPAHLVPPERRAPNGSSGDRSLILQRPAGLRQNIWKNLV